MQGGGLGTVTLIGRRDLAGLAHLTERVDDCRVVHRAAPRLDERQRLTLRHRAAVRTIRSEGVVAIDHGENPAAERNVCAAQPVGIPGPVPILVMMADDRGHRVREIDLRQDLRADARVQLHALELRRREAPRLVEDALRDRELADIVQQGGGLDGAQLQLLDADPNREFDGYPLDPPDVIVCHAVFRINGVCERLDSREVQAIDLGQVIELLGHSTGRVPVGVVQDDRQEQREREHDDAVSAELQGKHDESGADRTGDEGQPEVQEVSSPDRQGIPALVQCDSHRHRKRVEEEILRRKEQQPRSDPLWTEGLSGQRLEPRHQEEGLRGKPHCERRGRGVEQEALEGEAGPHDTPRHDEAVESNRQGGGRWPENDGTREREHIRDREVHRRRRDLEDGSAARQRQADKYPKLHGGRSSRKFGDRSRQHNATSAQDRQNVRARPRPGGVT